MLTKISGMVVKVSPGGSHLGASWSEGSEPNVILGFRVPSGSPQLAPLASSLLPLLPEHPWVPGVSWSEPNVILGPWLPGTFLEPQEAPSSLPLLPSLLPFLPLAPRESLGPWSLWGSRGLWAR